MQPKCGEVSTSPEPQVLLSTCLLWVLWVSPLPLFLPLTQFISLTSYDLGFFWGGRGHYRAYGKFPNQRSNPRLLQRKLRILTTGTPRKSLGSFLFLPTVSSEHYLYLEADPSLHRHSLFSNCTRDITIPSPSCEYLFHEYLIARQYAQPFVKHCLISILAGWNQLTDRELTCKEAKACLPWWFSG